MFGGAREKCTVCSKTVYEQEKTSVDGIILHSTCFRCSHCNNKLTLGTYAALDGKVYCKPHFKELFRRKGTYTFEESAPKTQDGGVTQEEPGQDVQVTAEQQANNNDE